MSFGRRASACAKPTPLALAAAQLVGVLGQHRLRGMEADGLHDPDRLRAPARSADVRPVQLDRAHEAVRDPVGGVDRGVRILEDHRHVAAVGEPVTPPAQRADRLALEPDLTGIRRVDQGQQPGDRALAAAALTDQRDDLPAPDAEADVVDRVQRLLRPEAGQAELPGNVVHLEQRSRRGCAYGGAWTGAGAASATRADRPARVPVPWRVLVQQAPHHRVPHVVQRRRHRRAFGHGVGATGLETAARRRRGHIGRRSGDAGERDLRAADGGKRLEQRAGVRMPWRGEQRSGGAELGHLAGVHDQHAVGEVPHQRDVVRDEEGREPEPVLQLLDLPHQ